MPKYTLTYFKAMGRAEVCRLIFAAAEQEYEDKRIDRFTETDLQKVMEAKKEDLVESEEWLAVKEKAPFGHLPILEVDDDLILAQSRIIAGYLARHLDLAGNGEKEVLKAAMVCETSYEFFMDRMKVFHNEKDETKKAEDTEKYTTETLPNILDRLEKMASDNGFFVGDKLSFADITFYHNTTIPPMMKIEVDLSKYPKLQKVCDNVTNNPGIAKWMKDRPETIF